MASYKVPAGDHAWSYDVATGRACCEYPAMAHEAAECEMAPDSPEPEYGLDHDCPRDRFLDDPITRAYGVGSEMVGLISCPVCEAYERDIPCDHDGRPCSSIVGDCPCDCARCVARRMPEGRESRG